MDQLSLTGIGMQRLHVLVICWLTCIREQTIANATAQIVEIFHHSFMCRTICVVRRDIFYPHQDNKQVNFYKKSSLYFIGWSLWKWKIAADIQLVKNWNISTKVWQKSLFYQHSQPLDNVMQKQTKNLEFVQGVNFEFIDSLKNNGTKYLWKFDDSFGEIRNSKVFVDNATAGKHRGLRTIYNKHNFFHQSKVGRDIELRNTRIFLLKSPRDVMQITTPDAELDHPISQRVHRQLAARKPFRSKKKSRPIMQRRNSRTNCL